MNPTITLPRQNSASRDFGGAHSSSRQDGVRMPKFFKRYVRPTLSIKRESDTPLEDELVFRPVQPQHFLQQVPR